MPGKRISEEKSVYALKRLKGEKKDWKCAGS